MNALISAIITARDTNLSMKVDCLHTQIKFILHFGCHALANQ